MFNDHTPANIGQRAGATFPGVLTCSVPVAWVVGSILRSCGGAVSSPHAGQTETGLGPRRGIRIPVVLGVHCRGIM